MASAASPAAPVPAPRTRPPRGTTREAALPDSVVYDMAREHASAATLPIGKLTDGFSVSRELGRGAFSKVYRGVVINSPRKPLGPRLKPGQAVAIKVIRFESFRDAELKRQLAILDQEVGILQRLNSQLPSHPDILVMLGVVKEPARICIVTEILEGGELFDRVVARKSYSEADAATLMRTLVSAVRAMHSVGVIHRDLKPENLVFASPAEDAPVRITDFGLARVDGWPDVHKFLVGTPGYVAPEVLAKRLYTGACDIWALGVILYVLLVGYPPFYAETNRELFEIIKRGQFYFHEEFWGRISVEAKDLVRRMLVVDPAKRLTADQILSHEWIISRAKRPDLPETLSKLREFNAKRKLKGAAMAAMVSARFGFKSRLASLVKSGSGSVSPSPSSGSPGAALTMAQLARIHQAFRGSSGKDGLVTPEDFKRVLADLNVQTSMPVERVFALFDDNGACL